MCGIAGILAREAAADLTGPLSAMVRALRHRGPDDCGVERPAGANGPSVALGHARLAIIDLSPEARQPMTDAETGNRIVYNGEIYNFREIRDELERAGARLRTRSDTEVVLKAYAAWGEGCLERLRGMFAFAIWDAGHRTLFAARDRLGKKPFYWFEGGGRFFFASEVRALLASSLVPRRPSLAGLSSFLSFGSVYDPDTMIDGVRALGAGHFLRWRNGRVEEAEYWNPADAARGGVEADRALAEADRGRTLSEVREQVKQAVRLRLVSDVPVGVFLSGGIDSSLVTAILSEGGSSRPSTFSVVFEEQEFDERPFSREIARRFRTDHHELTLSADGLAEAIPDAVRAMDQPTIDGLNTFVISREARRAGLKVAISGIGGDEVFGGYSTFATVPRLRRFASAWNLLPASVRSLAAGAFESLAPVGDATAKMAWWMRSNGEPVDSCVLARSLFLPPQVAELRSAGGQGQNEEWRAEVAQDVERATLLDPVNRVSYMELRGYLRNTLLRDTDFMSMSQGLEVRAPFLDHRLVESVLRIPGRWKMGGSSPKRLLVEAFEGMLPDEVVLRKKRGFTFPFERWMRTGLRPEIDAALAGGEPGALAALVDVTVARRTWHRFLEGRTSWSRPWALYVLDRWCREYLAR